VTGPFLLLLLVPGTVCPNTSRPHLLCLFFGVVWRLFSSDVHSPDIYRNFCSACAVTLLFADTLIVLFYLLTYLLPSYYQTAMGWIRWKRWLKSIENIDMENKASEELCCVCCRTRWKTFWTSVVISSIDWWLTYRRGRKSPWAISWSQPWLLCTANNAQPLSTAALQTHKTLTTAISAHITLINKHLYRDNYEFTMDQEV